ncbi:MAG: glycoside hydrolase family 97 N-terminal domain-containing protein, partial [Bacteroidota bacterium]
MKLFVPSCLLVLVLGFNLACNPESPSVVITQVTSPSKNMSVSFFLNGSGQPSYLVHRGETVVIDTSTMGFDFRDQAAMGGGFDIVQIDQEMVDETWEMPWGEQRTVRNHYEEAYIQLMEKEGNKRPLNLYVRAYDDGVAFRYEFPAQEGVDSLIIMDEHTEFNLTGDHQAWWIPGDWDIYEHLYNTTPLSGIDAKSKANHPNLAQSYIPENAVNTPVTLRTAEGLHLSFHEANLTDYSGMTLKVDTENYGFTSELVGSEITGYKVKRSLPFQTPWRTIQISEDAAGLIESNLIVNLNEPNKLGDVSWFTPMKYVGIWWEMHLNKSSWDLASGKHGATTENTKAYIDFAAENGMKGVLVEGWNTGWERWIGFEDR